jgi:hypothetical protein
MESMVYLPGSQKNAFSTSKTWKNWGSGAQQTMTMTNGDFPSSPTRTTQIKKYHQLLLFLFAQEKQTTFVKLFQ